MLIVFIKTSIITMLVFFVIRLMGKRQIGEMQPFEFVITLILAEVACLPMNDASIPLYYGIVPVITLAFLDIAITFIGRKSNLFRRIADGRSVLVVDDNGIVRENLAKMNMNVDDVVMSCRSCGYPDLSAVRYAVVEPNGKFSVIPKTTDPTKPMSDDLPLPLVRDGKIAEKNMRQYGITTAQLNKALCAGGIKSVKEVLYMDLRRDGTVYVSPDKKPCYTCKIKISGGAR